MDNSSVMLLRRLNPYCASALEAAASLCQTRAHAEITIEHWLLKLLEMGESDITVLARRYEWDMSTLWQSLLTKIDSLPRSIHSRPSLSKSLLNLIQNAWVIASLDEDIEHIRSVHILAAMVKQPSLVPNDALWPLMTLSITQLQRLRPMLDAQSDERPEVQQLAVHNQSLPAEAPLETQSTNETTAPNVIGNTLNDALLAVLNKFTVDVTDKAREGAIDPVFGRDDEIRQMVDILSRRRKNNPILVGEPGVGKTALVEGLALRIVEGNVPVSLQTTSLRTLDLGLLQAGAGVKGEFEQRLKNVIEAVQQSPTPILLFIDEAHTIIGAGNQAGGTDAANLLKPALARGELRTIAATTWSEYKQYFERDAALERRFQVVKVDEPDDEKACLMLRGLKPRYAKYHGVHITDDAVKAAVTLSRRYLTGRQLPDKAVDLLDTASARIRMSLDTLPEELTRLKAKRTALELEQQAILDDLVIGNTTNQPLLSELVTQDAQIAIQLTELEQRFEQEKNLISELLEQRRQSQDVSDIQSQLELIQQNEPLITPDVDVRTVATVIADWTGVPLSSLLKDEQTELLELEESLGKRVVGQESPLLALGQRLRAARTGLASENGPQTQLNLGHLVNAEREQRGDGFELRTDSWGAIRAGKGLLISTHEQEKANEQQLNIDEIKRQLSDALSMAESLSTILEKAEVEPLDNQTQETFLHGNITQLQEPVILAGAPGGIAVSTPKHIQHSSNGNQIYTAAGNTEISSLKRMVLFAKKKMVLFAHELGMKLVSAAGKIEIQAQTDAIDIIANKGLHITSTNDEIIISAKKKITLQSGGSYFTLEGGKLEHGTSGDFIVKSANLNYIDAATLNIPYPNFTACESVASEAARDGSATIPLG